MELTKYKFPKVSDLDLAFSTTKCPADLLSEAESRGFLHGHTKYNKMFSDIFFSGGSITFKKGIDQDFKTNAMLFFKSLAGSFEPKHEHKEAVCALLLSELAEVK